MEPFFKQGRQGQKSGFIVQQDTLLFIRTICNFRPQLQVLGVTRWPRLPEPLGREIFFDTNRHFSRVRIICFMIHDFMIHMYTDS